MTTQGVDLATLFARELDRLAGEIRAYESDDRIWSTQGKQKNSPGTLTLHLCGNLLHYIGAALGGSGYIRDRDAEFSDRCSKQELLVEIADTRDVITRVLASASDEVMNGKYPGRPPARMDGVGTRRFLMHLLWHFGWHEGQIYYHRLGGEIETQEL